MSVNPVIQNNDNQSQGGNDQDREVHLDTYAARRDAFMFLLSLRRIGNDILVEFTRRNGCRFAASLC